MIDWTKFYSDAVTQDILRPALEAAGVGNADQLAVRYETKPCRVIPCPGSYFPAHDGTCEMRWEEDEEWGHWTECACEQRARAVRDGA